MRGLAVDEEACEDEDDLDDLSGRHLSTALSDIALVGVVIAVAVAVLAFEVVLESASPSSADKLSGFRRGLSSLRVHLLVVDVPEVTKPVLL